MKKDKNKSNELCLYCGGTAMPAGNYTDEKEIRLCKCGVSIRYKETEIRVNGTDSNEVKEVSEHLFKQATELDETIKSESSLITKIMRLFSKKVKCNRFYKTKSRTIDITGLKTGVPENFDFGLASFKLDTKYHEASEKLKTLDLIQYGLCNDINAISNPEHKDKLLQKIVEAKTRMLEIVIELKENNDKEKKKLE